MAQAKARAPELWGGPECTIVRIGDCWRDQSRETGFFDRREDIDRIAALGIRTVRFPILWEQVAPHTPDDLDFGWSDDRLAMLRERGIGVIGGLLHHGSGPHYTHLLDPDLPARLADYAARVAERYKWIEAWTPVNEPLTTARFSCLYGHWYPHARDHGLFLRALANQCLATLEAMRAIRRVIPEARLVQTEDLGRCFATPPLRYQADFENERRWLSLDLLGGRVDEAHPFRGWLEKAGVAPVDLDRLSTGEARPDIIGINHYLTSERFLDHRTHLYPGHEVGGNGRDTYVDAEAVRVEALHDQTGFGPRLREAWTRYRLPMAITEVHHGCHRDEQLRWFAETRRTACDLRAEGIDLRAVTIWSLFGNVDWRNLLVRDEGFYDTGAFDARGPVPRPTMVAQAAASFARGEAFDHPVLDSPGWWRRPARLYPWNGSCKPMDWDGRKLLITGATGTLGHAFARACEHRALPFCLTARDELDLEDEGSIRDALDRHQPWAVINTAGYVRVPDAEREPDACMAGNAAGAVRLAAACAEASLPYVTFSTDLVFDGQAGRPYVESDAPAPTTVYGRSKAQAERDILAFGSQALILRTAAFFGPWDAHNFGWAVLSHLARGEDFHACPDTFVSPTWVPDLTHVALDLLIDGETGIWHLANAGRISWHGFARAIAQGAGLDPERVVAAPSGRPADTSLTSERGVLLRSLDKAIDDFVREVAPRIEGLQVAAE